MPLRKAMRESAFQLARHDLAQFLRDHEEELMAAFQEEMEALDERIPEEGMYIDIKIVALGDAILKAAIDGLVRFLSDETLADTKRVKIDARSQEDERGLTLKD